MPYSGFLPSVLLQSAMLLPTGPSGVRLRSHGPMFNAPARASESNNGHYKGLSPVLPPVSHLFGLCFPALVFM